ncbi:MAG: transcriptional coactivator hfi1/ADA1 [Piccolia ochrophora]|nr:MAG: transcriptional coactivator hfi1/ADA1 [Piccolia ochrophora]
MPDIDPAALTRVGSGSTATLTPLPPTKSLSTPSASSQKPAKTVSMGQRIDLEPMYTALKAAVGENWLPYKEAISLFILGHLDQIELATRIETCLGGDVAKEHMHNQLIAAVYGNVTRDLPDHGVASWVSANDKPTTVSKPVSGDAAEQRLKTEVMQLPARDRRRLKDIPELDPFDTYSNLLAQSRTAKQIKIPDTGPISAGGLNKTNWDLEIRKRYTAPLSSETFEFPDSHAISTRLLPSCYEAGLMHGPSTGCASFLVNATEAYIKELLTSILGRVRSNAPGSSIATASYKRHLAREEAAVARGELARSTADSLLPVETAALAGRKPLGGSDLRFALELGGAAGLGSMPLVVAKVVAGWMGEGGFGGSYDSPREPADVAPAALLPPGLDANGPSTDWGGWEGGGTTDQEALGRLLDDCLVVGGP